MTLETTINGLGLVSTSICLLLVAFLFSAPTNIRVANRFLAGFLLLTAIDLSGWFSYAILSLPIPIRMFRTTLAFLQMPLFLGYFAAVCRADLKPRRIWVLHLVPFALANLILTPRVYLGLWGEPPPALARTVEYQILEIGLELQYYCYALAAFLLLRRFRAVFLERYSDSRSKTFTWLGQLLAVSLAAHALVTVKSLSVLDDRRALVLSLELVVAVIALSVTVWIALKALRHPDLFRGVDSRLKRVAELLSSSAEEPLTRDLERVRAFMNREAPYLDPALNLETLAGRLGMSPRSLSVLINHQLGVHFFDFVNNYRIERAKALLLTPAARSNLMAVMFDAGFNSKSSFNTAFKKHAGVTPSQYRRQYAIAASTMAGGEKRPTS